ncbi:PREDICTED: alkaline phosphatase-like [Priapulus caudatus]|uniref:alkaline phosphatase n=1 Tax=Priapulus caudatus TaxID=37621 RepID=A0ABM1E713_PRICU|nr:PREDICTED: alkaline phosphatase-like [Priapulus caudatus]
MMVITYTIAAQAISLFCLCTALPVRKLEDKEFWFANAREALRETLAYRNNENVARNTVLFMGDGMGMSTVTAARILKGQKAGQPGEEAVLEFEKFPNVGLIKTYNVEIQVGESASAATAYLCGAKTNKDGICMDATSDDRCDSSANLISILQLAQEAGKSVGFVTTDTVAAASVSPLYSHAPSDSYKYDGAVPTYSACKDIASQLIDNRPGQNIQVVMGGGREYFLPVAESGHASNETEAGLRTDGRNLELEWLRQKQGQGVRHKLVQNTAQLLSVDTAEVDYVLGLFASHKMPYHMDRDEGPKGSPSLPDMVDVAIKILKKNPKGFFLFVENEKIDDGHHMGAAVRAVSEVLPLEVAVQQTISMTDAEDTLLVVTADHSHNMIMSGYPPRGNPIFGLGGVSNRDLKPYTTLLYGLSPGRSISNGTRINITGVDTTDKNYLQQAVAPRSSGVHAGEDVATYATGAMSHLFVGVREQSYLMHAMAYAACLGEYEPACAGRRSAALSSRPAKITEMQPPIKLIDERRDVLELDSMETTEQEPPGVAEMTTQPAETEAETEANHQGAAATASATRWLGSALLITLLSLTVANASLL